MPSRLVQVRQVDGQPDNLGMEPQWVRPCPFGSNPGKRGRGIRKYWKKRTTKMHEMDVRQPKLQRWWADHCDCREGDGAGCSLGESRCLEAEQGGQAETDLTN